MKRVFWILFLVACSAFAGWVVLGPWAFRNPLALFFVTFFFMVPPIGSAWMLYQSIRYEEKSLPFVILALVPYSFLWYYFEHYRKRTEAERIPPPSDRRCCL